MPPALFFNQQKSGDGERKGTNGVSSPIFKSHPVLWGVPGITPRAELAGWEYVVPFSSSLEMRSVPSMSLNVFPVMLSRA
jgi:hypothetical protein